MQKPHERLGGGIDALVNNASTFYPGAVADVTETQWDELLGANLKAPFFLAGFKRLSRVQYCQSRLGGDD